MHCMIYTKPKNAAGDRNSHALELARARQPRRSSLRIHRASVLRKVEKYWICTIFTLFHERTSRMASKPDILETIVAQRRLDVAESRALMPEAVLVERIQTRYPSRPTNLYEAINEAKGMAVAAEFKRASPSKGDMILPGTTVESNVSAYCLGGATILSVLTEPHWFKGSLADMETARATSTQLSTEMGRQRPVILRKEFVFDEYQILEARAYGADTVLLIVATLSTVEVLEPLIRFARHLGMEPLVEVNSVPEMDVAMAAGSRCIGINNRNLRTFTVDLGTTVRVVAHAAKRLIDGVDSEPVAILSLSGIRSEADVQGLVDECALAQPAPATQGASSVPPGLRVMRGFLIGEALMRSEDPRAMVASLVAAASDALASSVAAAAAADGHRHDGGGSGSLLAPTGRITGGPMRAKVCGVKRADDAVHAARCGADFIGSIMVKGSPRGLDVGQAAQVTHAMRGYREQDPSAMLQQLLQLKPTADVPDGAVDYQRLIAAHSLLQAALQRAKPLSVGVYMDAAPADVSTSALAAGFDVIQLHGDEQPSDYCSSSTPAFPLPLIKVLHVPVPLPENDDDAAAVVAGVVTKVAAWSRVAAAILLDSKAIAAGSASGGTGAVFDHGRAFDLLGAALTQQQGTPASPSSQLLPIMVAGGLTPETVASIIAALAQHTTSTASSSAVQTVVWCVDVSSGVEYPPDTILQASAPAGIDAAAGKPVGKGVKDPARVEAFVRGAKRKGEA